MTTTEKQAGTTAIPLPVQIAATQSITQVCETHQTSTAGLTTAEAGTRLNQVGLNVLPARRITAWMVLFRQLNNPILILLVVAALLSFLTGDRIDAVIILTILAASIGLGFFNEWKAEREASALHSQVAHTIVVVRAGQSQEVAVANLVPGDIVRLSLGCVVPADLRLLQASNLSADESIITGESVAANKSTNPIEGGAGLGDLTCALLMGTVIHSGSGLGVVVATGSECAFGRIAQSLNTALPQTGFQKGLVRFSTFLLYVALSLTIFIFAANLLLQRPLLDAMLFALAIAVGITPQLLPAVVNTSLAAGAKQLAAQQVLVKRLTCIEDLGNVDILITDKTGTLTQGHISYDRAVAAKGSTQDELLLLGLLSCETDFTEPGATSLGQNEIDRALSEAVVSIINLAGYQRLDLRPFDHDTRTSAVLIATPDHQRLQIIKGAPEAVLPACSNVDPADLAAQNQLFAQGIRSIAVAKRNSAEADQLPTTQPKDFTLLGFLTFLDLPKADAADALHQLAELGVAVKVATGDNLVVAEKVCHDLGLAIGTPLTGDQIDQLDDEQLYTAAHNTALLARVSPDHKARIISVLRRDHTVAFLGDGVNDAPALHKADVGISVDSATDVAKDAADIVLLEKDLGVIVAGVIGGRRIFANTIKYIQMGTSSNFGNMFSAALASVVLPFLPMLPGQLLLNNLLYDASQLAIPTDRVDQEALRKPAHWDITDIRRFMFTFGPISSIFDFLTFGLLLFILHAQPSEFRAGWFVESLATQTLIVFVIRTRAVPFFRSRPSLALGGSVLAVVAIGALIPYLPFASTIGFTPLPLRFFLALVGMVVLYLILTETMKIIFFRTNRPQIPTPVAAARSGTMRPSGLSAAARHYRRLRRRAQRFTVTGSHH